MLTNKVLLIYIYIKISSVQSKISQWLADENSLSLVEYLTNLINQI